MKQRRIAPLAMAALAGAALSGCAQDLAEPPYRAEVIDLVGFERGSEGARYELAVRELTHLEDFERLEGEWLRLRRGGVLEIREVAGSVIEDGRFHGGEPPELRYHLEGDVAVARDYPTLVMLSAYYHFERIFESIEQITGMPAEDLVSRTGKYEVLFEPLFRVKGKQSDTTASMKFNAFFLPGAYQFGLARRSSIESVPLATDLQVLSHEFGHALFEQTFFGGEAPECREATDGEQPLDGRLTVEYAVSGMNEGFGDFIAFAITGGTNPLGDYDFVGDERSIVESDHLFMDLEEPDELEGGGDAEEPACTGAFYCIGTLLARSLYQSFQDLGFDPESPEDRAAFAREVVGAMTLTRETLRDRAELPPPAELTVADCERAESIDLEYDGEVTGAFLAAFASNLGEASRAAFCARALENFGELGFPNAADACGESR